MSDLPQWHSIRPWRPTLALSVREITSVSATFILSSAFRSSADNAAVEQSLAALGLSNDEDSSDGDSTNVGPQIVSDVLSKGLSVKVNGTPWQRVLMRIDDDADEAVIILFGLMPGRQYDIELGIVPNEKILRQITTSSADSIPGASSSEQPFIDSSGQTMSTSTSQSESLHAPAQPEQVPPSAFSLEDRRLQLTHKLNLIAQEHSTLTGTLKSARRDAQKADAALRAEIDILRRASDRQAPAEMRARQKALALQEAARQALATAEQVQGRVQELEQALPELLKKRNEVERECEKVRKEADAVRARREEAEAEERKRLEAKQSELASLVAKLDKLNVRKEKLDGESGVIHDLEDKLRRLEEERERIESDPYGYSYEDAVADDDDEVVSSSRADDNAQQHTDVHRPQYHGNHSHPHARKRHSHSSNQKNAPQPIARPEPIQRPSQGSRTTNANASTTSLPPGPGVIHLHHAHTHSVSSGSRRQQQQQSPSVSGSASGASGSSNSSSPSSAHAHAHTHSGTSVLSSRAPPFEPRGANANVRSDLSLNPGSSPFEPRVGAVPQTQTTTAGTSLATGKSDTAKKVAERGRP